jgi:hypothetical protein
MIFLQIYQHFLAIKPISTEGRNLSQIPRIRSGLTSLARHLAFLASWREQILVFMRYGELKNLRKARDNFG